MDSLDHIDGVLPANQARSRNARDRLLQAGERVCILANTRPEWSYADLAATSVGTVVVPIYQTNSPEECLWVISDSGASAIVCLSSLVTRRPLNTSRIGNSTPAHSI